MPFRIFEFLIGALFLWVYKNKSSLKSDLLSLFGILMIVIPSVYFSNSINYSSLYNIIPCLGAGFLIYSGGSKYSSRILNNKVFQMVGKLSYTLYLVHWPLIVFYKYVYQIPK